MFQLKTLNMRFEHNEGPFKGCLGQRSCKVIRGHQVQKAKICHLLYAFKFLQNLKYVTLACNQGKSSDHIMF